MVNFNKVILLGNLTRDPDLRYIENENNTPVSGFGLSVNHKYKKQNNIEVDEALFIEASVFGRAAEKLNRSVKKGDLILVEGRLKLEQWRKKETGEKRNKITLVVNNFRIVKSAEDSASTNEMNATNIF